MYASFVEIYDKTPNNRGTIIIKVITIEGLNNQYNKPIENINIQNSFL